MRNKKSSYLITIPEPCKEDWNEMTPIEKGKHCSVCKVNLIDFTQFSDKKLINYLSKNKDTKACGHFYSSQLDRVISKPEEHESNFLLRATAVLAMMGGALSGYAQVPDSIPKKRQASEINKPKVYVEGRISTRPIFNDSIHLITPDKLKQYNNSNLREPEENTIQKEDLEGLPIRVATMVGSFRPLNKKEIRKHLRRARREARKKKNR
jgi:hypothetical protein